MKSLSELNSELRKYENLLTSISSKKEGNTQFKPGELDGHSERYSYTEYSDPEKAAFYQSKINSLREEIANYGRNAQLMRERQEKKVTEEESLRKNQILSAAKEIYEEKMDEYMQKNFIGKAKMLFSGKKPKFMKTQEINKIYGDEAVSRIISPEVNDLIRRKEEQLKKAHELYANDPQKLEYAIKATNDFFDSEITKINAIYNDSLDEMNLGGNSR